MTETLEAALETLRQVGESVSRENPVVDQQFKQVEEAVEHLGTLAEQARSQAH